MRRGAVSESAKDQAVFGRVPPALVVLLAGVAGWAMAASQNEKRQARADLPLHGAGVDQPCVRSPT